MSRFMVAVSVAAVLACAGCTPCHRLRNRQTEHSGYGESSGSNLASFKDFMAGRVRLGRRGWAWLGRRV